MFNLLGEGSVLVAWEREGGQAVAHRWDLATTFELAISTSMGRTQSGT